MERKVHLLGVVLSGAGAFIGEKLGVIGPALVFFCLLMFMDYASALLACRKEALEHPNDEKFGWNSKKGVIGIYKKVGYFFTVFAAFGLDYVIVNLIADIIPGTENKGIFGMLVLTWFILNELLSILENVGRMGVNLPTFLVNAISGLKKDIEQNK